MAPTLLPGDWLLADPDAFRDRPPAAGDLVLLPDPREPARLLVKRVAEVDRSSVVVVGDAEHESTDSRVFGPVDIDAVEGRPWFRYWPPRRIGRIG